jgi:hypothetical protein
MALIHEPATVLRDLLRPHLPAEPQVRLAEGGPFLFEVRTVMPFWPAPVSMVYLVRCEIFLSDDMEGNAKEAAQDMLRVVLDMVRPAGEA